MNNNEKIEYIATHYSKLMHAAANSILNDYHEAEDACQEAIMRLYRVADTLEDVRTVRTRAYCVTTARNTAVMMARKKAKQIPYEEMPILTEKDEFENTSTAEAVDLLNDLDELPEKYRNIIRLRCFENRSAAETAELMNSNIATVNSQLLRARALLKNKWVSIACLCCSIAFLAAVFLYSGIRNQSIYYAPDYSEEELEEYAKEVPDHADGSAYQNELPASGDSLSESELYKVLDQKALAEVEGASEEDITEHELIEKSETEFIYKATIRYNDQTHVIRMGIDGEIISHEIR